MYVATFLALAALANVLCHVVRGMPWEVWLRDVFWSAYGPGPAGGAACYGLFLSAVFWLYFRLVKAFRASRADIGFVLAVGACLHLILAAATPSRSIDVFSYLAHGYNTGQDLHLAYVTPAYAVKGTPYGDALAAIYRTPPAAHGPTPYGPLWTYFEYFAVRLTGLHVFRGTLILKLGTVAANLGSTVLIWNIFAATAPALQCGGVVAFLFNPLILSELALDGHNDAWMIFLVLCALSLLVRRRTAAACFALCLAVLTKLVPVLLIPAFLRAIWEKDRARGLKDAAAGLAMGAVGGAALYAPLWAGSKGFGGVQHILGDGPALGRLVLPAVHSPTLDHSLFAASLIVYSAFFLRETLKTDDAPAIFEGGACLLLAYFLFFPTAVWCWYATLPVTLLLLSPRRASRLFAYALTVAGAINSPLWSFTGRQDVPIETRQLIQDWTGAAVLICLLVAYLWSVKTQRTGQGESDRLPEQGSNVVQ